MPQWHENTFPEKIHSPLPSILEIKPVIINKQEMNNTGNNHINLLQIGVSRDHQFSQIIPY